MTSTKLILSTALLFGVLTTANSQEESLFDTGKLKSYINTIHLKMGFSGEILIAEGKNILFHEAIRTASYEHNIQLKKGAKYRIGSITKTFAGTLIALAQEEGKLNIKDKAINYIDDLAPKFKDITIEHLLSHTSGLPHNEGISDYWMTKSLLHITREQVLKEINSLATLSKPGSKMRYTSLGYYLLALILENVYKNSFYDLLKSKILDKLQMTSTGTVDNLKIIPQMASGYHQVTDDSLVVAPYRNYTMLKGAGDMYSTATDLLKWNISFLSNTPLNEKINAALFVKQQGITLTDSRKYHYGWYVNLEKPHKQYHGGGTWGYSTHTALYAEEKISIIILGNVSTLPISSIAEDVEKIVFRKPFQLPTIAVISKEPTNHDIYMGTFISDSNEMALSIFKVKNSVYAKLGNNPPFEIYPKGKHQFLGKKVEINFNFEVTDNTATGLSAEGMGKIFHFRKDLK